MGNIMKNTELLKNTIALGTTSALAVVAASQQATAEGAYIGFSAGAIAGESPNDDAGSDDYSLNGGVLSVFAGVDKDLGNNRFAGVELAYQGAANGNEEDNGYDYAYQLNYVVDAKIRYGASFGQNLSAYGFVGASTGNANSYNYASQYGGYSFFGANAGAGVQMEVANGITAGVEYIHRFVKTGYDDGQDLNSNHGALSARVSMNF
jgi:hypothetical protein